MYIYNIDIILRILYLQKVTFECFSNEKREREKEFSESQSLGLLIYERIFLLNLDSGSR